MAIKIRGILCNTPESTESKDPLQGPDYLKFII